MGICMLCGGEVTEKKGLFTFATGTLSKIELEARFEGRESTYPLKQVGGQSSIKLQYRDPLVCKKCKAMFPKLPD